MDLYIVVSQTGTYFSRLLRAVNREPYNHVSIGLEPELKRLYSFGRQCLFSRLQQVLSGKNRDTAFIASIQIHDAWFIGCL